MDGYVLVRLCADPDESVCLAKLARVNKAYGAFINNPRARQHRTPELTVFPDPLDRLVDDLWGWVVPLMLPARPGVEKPEHTFSISNHETHDVSNTICIGTPSAITAFSFDRTSRAPLHVSRGKTHVRCNDFVLRFDLLDAAIHGVGDVGCIHGVCMLVNDIVKEV